MSAPITSGKYVKTPRPILDPASEELLTIPEAARVARVKAHTMFRWVLTGKVESIKLGRLRRTSREAIARFAADCVE